LGNNKFNHSINDRNQTILDWTIEFFWEMINFFFVNYLKTFKAKIKKIWSLTMVTKSWRPKIFRRLVLWWQNFWVVLFMATKSILCVIKSFKFFGQPTSLWPRLTLGWPYFDVTWGCIYVQMQPSNRDKHIDVVTTLVGIVIQ
jgi:hypothetical protein